MSDTISKNKFVSLTYTITDDNDNILERTDMPIQHIQGVNSQVIDKIEKALEGHQVGRVPCEVAQPEPVRLRVIHADGVQREVGRARAQRGVVREARVAQRRVGGEADEDARPPTDQIPYSGHIQSSFCISAS